MAEEGDVTYTQEQFDEQVAGLKSALEKEREERRTAKAKLGDLQATYDGLQQQVEELKQAAAAKEAGVSDDKLKEIRDKIRADFEREYSPLKEKVGKLETSLGERDGKIRELTLDNVVKGEMGKAGVRADRTDALFRLTSDRYELSEEGEVILQDARETPLYKYLSEELSMEYPEFYEGSGSSGGGASRSAGSAGKAKRYIAAGDDKAFLDNVEEIARGEVEVR